MRFAPLIILLACSGLPAQQPPGPTDLPSKPFFVKSTWVIGGSGGWDSLTMDSQAHRLFIAHGATVQVVDTESGQLAGAVSHLGEAHAIALDTTGQFGYISDGRANQIKIFDRSTLQVIASIPVGSSPRALVFEPQTETLFVFGPEQASSVQAGAQSGGPAASANRNAGPGPCGTRNGNPIQQSLVSIVDTEKRSRIAEIEICGTVAGAAADADGQVYFNLSSLDEIARVSATDILELAKDRQSNAKPAGNSAATPYALIDWRNVTAQRTLRKASPNPQLTLIGVAPDCHEPTGLTIDTHNQQLFASCGNQRMVVVDAGSGNLVTSIPIGAGAEEIAYDSERNLLFSANGAGTGTLTVIRQTIPDSYAVVQTLPTRANARTAVVDPATGRVYVVTVLSGMKVDNPPADGIGKLNINPIEASFQVLVIGN
jgi:YVTN family beta-propeller protein